MESRETAQSSAKKRLLILLHAGFLFIGIITVLLGQILPVLSRRLSLDDREAGYLFVAQFAGSLAGTFLYSRIIKKFGYLRLLAGGFCLIAGGCAALNFDAWILSLSAIFLYGIGIGLTIPTVNLLVVELNREKSSSALNTINFFWGFGAILCKPFVDFLASPDSILLPTTFLCFAFLLLGAVFAISDFEENFNRDENFSTSVRPVWTTRTAWLIAIFNFVHIGIESSVGGWITTYQSRLAQNSANNWLSAAVVFFSFLVFGRAVAPLFFRFLRDNAVLFCSLAVMTAGIVLILQAESFSFLMFGAATLGFGTSAVFPTNMSRFTKIFGSQATENAAPLFVFGSLGGAFTTWLVGFTSTASGSLRTGLFVVLINCVLLIVLQIILANIKSK
jgi:FHS family glucose/mannose:H+ symporter-like MFS transporter